MTPLEAVRNLRRHQPEALHPASAGLSPRVRQVLDYLLLGDSEKQIAGHLSLSQHTVHDYVKQIYRHFKVNSRAELLALFVARSAAIDSSAVRGDPKAPHPAENAHQGPAPQATAGKTASPAPIAELELPPASSSEEERVVYCVQLLAQRGFIIRWTEAATQLIHRRRGMAASIVIAILCLIGTLALRMDGYREASPIADADVTLMEVVRQMEVGPPGNGQWLEIGRAERWETLEWQPYPPEAEAYLMVGNQLLTPGQAHVMHAGGDIHVRVPEGIPPMLYITVSRPAQPK